MEHEQRDYLGISELGQCARRVIYAHTPGLVPQYSPESQRLMKLGTLIEEMRREELKREGFPVHQPQCEVVFGPAKGHIDGYIATMGGNLLWECKSTSSPAMNKWYREGLPTYYAFQIAGYLEGLSTLLGEKVQFCRFEVLDRLSGEVSQWTYPHDEVLTRNALNRAEYLHRAMQEGVLLDRECAASSSACRNCRFQAECRPDANLPKSNGEIADANDWQGFQEAVALYESAQSLKDEGAALASKARDSILDALRRHNVTKAKSNGHQVTWSVVECSRFDSKAFQQAHPDLFAQFERQSQYGKLTLRR